MIEEFVIAATIGILGGAGAAYVVSTRGRGPEDAGSADDETQYSPCGDYGHDFRDDGPTSITTEFIKNDSHFKWWLGIDTQKIDGRVLGLWNLVKETEQPCRDCSETKGRKESLGSRIVYELDNEILTVAYNEAVKEQNKERLNDE